MWGKKKPDGLGRLKKAPEHVGLLLISPPGAAGLTFIKSSNNLKDDDRMSAPL